MLWRSSIVVGACLLAACSNPAPKPAAKESTAPIQTYELHGEVKHLDNDGNIATIKHGPLGDWMGAMTMEFPVKDPKEYTKLRVGEQIKATVHVQDLRFWVDQIQEEPSK